MNETLLVLKLNGNKICNKGAMAIAGSLQVNMTLEELDMADTDMVGGNATHKQSLFSTSTVSQRNVACSFLLQVSIVVYSKNVNELK